MKRVVCMLLSMFLIMPNIFLVGCSDKAYIANMKMRENTALFESTNKRQAVETIFTSINTIVGVVEDIAMEEKVPSKFVDKLGTVENNQSNFAMAVLGDIMTSMVVAQAKAEIARARAEAIRYLEPIVTQIYKQESERIGTPATANDVTMRFFDNIPLLATVGGMYGLGVAALDKAGTQIKGTFTGSEVAVGDNAEMIKESFNKAGDASGLGTQGGGINSGGGGLPPEPVEVPIEEPTATEIEAVSEL